jgi:hypothetical protein
MKGGINSAHPELNDAIARVATAAVAAAATAATPPIQAPKL